MLTKEIPCSLIASARVSHDGRGRSFGSSINPLKGRMEPHGSLHRLHIAKHYAMIAK
jgi:hypothetical protein